MPKYECSFCGKSNTKYEDEYVSSGFLNLGSTKIGEKEIVDTAIDFYRCLGCGRFYCAEHYEALCCKTRKEKGWISNKTIAYNECPRCSCNDVKKAT